MVPPQGAEEHSTAADPDPAVGLAEAVRVAGDRGGQAGVDFRSLWKQTTKKRVAAGQA